MDRVVAGRRGPSILALLTVFGVLLSACGGGGAPSPTAAPAKPAEAAKPAASPAASPAAGASPSPAASPAAAAKPGTGTGLVSGPFQGEAQSLNGAGATFPAPLYTRWFNDYARLTNVQVNYQAVGSGAGIRAITDRTADFGATDAPMTDQQLAAAQAEILHIPTAIGAVVPTYNLPNVQGALRFSPDTLANIFLGEISNWNDQRIAADNPGASLPDRDIVVIHRSDASGTTSIFTDYLSTVSPQWKGRVGTGTSVNWPTGLGAQGNPGVTNEVRQNEGAIGYVELIYALQNRLPAGAVRNQAGQYVEPTLESTTAAAAGIADTIAPDLRASIVNPPGQNAFPIAGLTWILAYRESSDRPKQVALARLLWWATHDGQPLAGELGYAPLPPGIVTRAEERINSMQAAGERAFPGR